MIRRCVASLLVLPLIGAAPERDWAATLRTDAQALHDDIAANHPGPYNQLDPGFTKRAEAAFALVMKRADRVRDYAGYRYALLGYSASFDDGHLAAYPAKDAPGLDSRWPGFLTGFDGKRHIVMTRTDTAPVPLGAVLTGCDGRTAEALAASNIGAFDGRWFLASRRALRSGRLFIDQGNPFIRRPARCTFVVDGKPRAVTLDWQPIEAAALSKRVADTNQRTREPIGAKILPDGTRWFTMSGFDGDPDGPDSRALKPMIAAMRADRAAIAAAPRIVIDLRGNNGGSSDWSLQVGQILWGEAAVAALPDTSYIEWRASPAVSDAMTAYRTKFEAAPDTSPAMRAYFNMMVSGLASARAKGAALWREPSFPSAPPKPGTPIAPLTAPVYFITDTGCGSACLDAVDLWRALGAIEVGQETSADTLYMDVRNPVLPSGLTAAAIPMKVYRNRPRGSNAPVAPDYPYPGDLRDTAKLAAWIATLPRTRK